MVLPHSDRRPWFTFIGHPRNLEDLMHTDVGRLLHGLGTSDEQIREGIGELPPVVVGEITFGSEPIRGELMLVMCLPEAIQTPAGKQAIQNAAQIAHMRGSDVVGLGALTSPATGSGLTLVPHMPLGLTLTTGNAYTAAAVRQNVEEAVALLGRGAATIVAVVGCTGSVGTPATYLLARAGYRLILIGRSADRVRTLFSSLASQALFSGSIADLQSADVIVLLTNDSGARVKPYHVKPGAILLDCAQPANIERHDADLFRRQQVSVVEGAIVRIPNYYCTFDVGLPRTDTFACLAETYLFARAGIRHHSVGRPTAEFALEMERLAQHFGLYPRSIQAEVMHFWRDAAPIAHSPWSEERPLQPYA